MATTGITVRYGDDPKEYLRQYNAIRKEHIAARRREREKLPDVKAKAKIYRDANKDKAAARSLKYRTLNDVANREKKKKYHIENREKINKRTREWATANRERRIAQSREYSNLKRARDPLFRLKSRISCLVRNSLSSHGFKKGTKLSEILGCSKPEFMKWLEDQFEPWMTWNNAGSVNGKSPTGINQCWDIDHFIPMATAITESDAIRLNHYTNLRPLCSFVNRFIKKDKHPDTTCHEI